MTQTKKNNIYTEPVAPPKKRFGDLMTVKLFKECVSVGSFKDDTGHGYPVKEMKLAPLNVIHPSKIDLIPEDATHVLWIVKQEVDKNSALC